MTRERDAVRQRIEQRIRSTMHLAGATFANIRLSQDAADAAKKNLDVVRDAYGRGGISYLNLLDAQNASLQAQRVAASATYDFLVDAVGVQRAAAYFPFMERASDNQDWHSRFIETLAETKWSAE